jgi:hypothetical protein
MGIIETAVKHIMESIYGKDVRAAIADAIAYMWEQEQAALNGYSAAQIAADQALGLAGPATNAANAAANAANAAANAANAALPAVQAELPTLAKKDLSNVPNGKVTAGMLASGAALANLANGSIDATKLKAGAAAANLGDKSIGSAKLADGAAAANLGNKSVGSAKLADGAALANLANNSVPGAKLQSKSTTIPHDSTAGSGGIYLVRTGNVVIATVNLLVATAANGSGSIPNYYAVPSGYKPTNSNAVFATYYSNSEYTISHPVTYFTATTAGVIGRGSGGTKGFGDHDHYYGVGVWYCSETFPV